MFKYPSEFSNSLREELNYYLQHNTDNVTKIIMKKLIEDLAMQQEVFPKLLKIKNVTMPDTIPPPKATAISMFLHYCLTIYTHSIGIKPLTLKDYKASNKVIGNAMRMAVKHIKRLEKAGVYHPGLINGPLIASLENTASFAEKGFKNKPAYLYGNLSVSRNTRTFSTNYFITRLWLHTRELFNKELYAIIAVAANAVFKKNGHFSEGAVKKIIFEFKKHITLKK